MSQQVATFLLPREWPLCMPKLQARSGKLESGQINCSIQRGVFLDGNIHTTYNRIFFPSEQFNGTLYIRKVATLLWRSKVHYLLRTPSSHCPQSLPPATIMISHTITYPPPSAQTWQFWIFPISCRVLHCVSS